MLKSKENDCDNNLFATGGGIDKYDKLFNTEALKYQIEHHSIPQDSKRSDKHWAGFCDRAAMLSCLYRYPTQTVIVNYNSNFVEFQPSDIEALMIIVSNTTVCKSLSVFYGSRNNSKKKNSEKRGEPFPLELIEILSRFSKESEPFVIDVDNGAAVWNYPFDKVLVTIESIDFLDNRIPITGKNVIYRFVIESSAFPDKNIDILGLVNYNNGYIHQEWLSDENPDFLWKDYRNKSHWKGKSDINPHIDPEIVYKIYKNSVMGNGILNI
tara:strand:- start:1596 stop:2399 length:804 start_codon:yes stop_codon:yes gene_type:complete